MPDTSPEANKQVLRRWVTAVSAGQFDLVPEFWTPDLVLHAGWEGAGMGTARGYAGMEPVFSKFGVAFPNGTVTLKHVMAEDDRVTGLYELDAVHEGVYFGVPATGRRIHAHFLGMYRFVEGRIAEAWAIDDGLTILDQIGALPVTVPQAE